MIDINDPNLNVADLRKELALAYARLAVTTSTPNAKLGLTYARIPEESENMTNLSTGSMVPVLTSDTKLSIRTSGQSHILVEADNLPAMVALVAASSDRYHVVFADILYNTGSDLKYNDKLVDDSDGYRHSKSMNFNVPRIILMRELCRDDGVVIIMTGSQERAYIEVLCDGLFGESNKLGVLPRRSKAGNDAGVFFGPSHDYVLVYAKNRSRVNPFKIYKDAAINSDYSIGFNKTDTDGRRWKPKGLYMGSLRTSASMLYMVECPDASYAMPPNSVWYPPMALGDGIRVLPAKGYGAGRGGGFRWGSASYLDNKQDIFISRSSNSPLVTPFGASATWNVSTKQFFDTSIEKGNVPKDMILDHINTGGTAELKAILGKDQFSYPKPVSLLKYLLTILNMPSDMRVLDPFAGSGTTMQAVLEMNAADGGSRHCTLITNNEDEFNDDSDDSTGIARSVTQPRIKALLTGEWADGKPHLALPGNLHYYQLEWRHVGITDDSKIADLKADFAGIAALNLNTHHVLTETDELTLLGGEDGKRVIVFKDADAFMLDEDALAETIDKLRIEFPGKTWKVLLPTTAEGLDYLDEIPGVTMEAFPLAYISALEGPRSALRSRGLLRH